MKLDANSTMTLKEKLPWAIEEQVQKSQEEIKRKNLTQEQLTFEYNRQNDKYIKTLMNNSGDITKCLVQREAYARELVNTETEKEE